MDLDIRDVDRLGRLVQGSRNLHFLPGERLGSRLVVQLVERLRRSVEQNELTTHLHAGESTRLSVVGTLFFEHRLVPPILAH